PELLFLGMMFHDVGKGHGHDHAGRGARMMRDIATRLGLNVDESAACEFLVRHHLLMSHLAQRRDVDDDQLIVDFCRTVGSVDNLQRLYVLTYADMRAVGPGVWNNWRDSLLAELYLRAREFLEKGAVEPEDRAARAARVRARIEAAAPAAGRAGGEVNVEELVERSARPSILARRRRRVPTSVEIHNEVSREYTVLDVYTGDRVGLLFTITNTLYHLWLEIHLAKITTMVDQVLDV